MADKEREPWIAVASAAHLQSKNPPRKIDSLLTQPDTLCEGERKWEIKERRIENRGLHLPKERRSRSGPPDRFPQWMPFLLETTYLRLSNRVFYTI